MEHKVSELLTKASFEDRKLFVYVCYSCPFSSGDQDGIEKHLETLGHKNVVAYRYTTSYYGQGDR